MPLTDLAQQTASLLSLPTATEERALHQLAVLAVRQVTGCAAASVAIWRDDEVAAQASSHPDATRLTEIELDCGRGPITDALATRVPVQCMETLGEARWPEYAMAAVRLGVRCSVTLCAGEQSVVTLSLLGARPRAMDLEQLQLAELVAAYSAALVGAVSDYRDSRRTTVQLQDAAAGRGLVDQAKGILMHALGCSADEALARIRDMSQRSNMRATDVAERVIDAYSGRPAAAADTPQAGDGSQRRPPGGQPRRRPRS
ncbi:MAG TPA: GAF and ANTAR domain-containing protein [Streptosporangiaceae bacterium]|nr:GAF and ANTAR domain-containing protein [Streptosporangiaceae bacterium]